MIWFLLVLLFLFIYLVKNTPNNLNLPNARNSDMKFEINTIRFNTKKAIKAFNGNFVALDLETTGLTTKDEIIEIGMVKYLNYVKVEQFSTLINPGCIIPSEASKVNGITNNMLNEKPDICSVLLEIKKFIDLNLIVCHNAAFDMKFILRDFYTFGHSLDNSVVCTLQFSKSVLKYQDNYKLASIARYFKIKDNGFHRALGDAEVTAQVFLHLIETQKKIFEEAAVAKEKF